MLKKALGRISWLDRARFGVGSWFIMPWEWPTLFSVRQALYYPKFQRGWDAERAAAEDMAKVAGHTMTKYDRCAALHQLVKHVEDAAIPGALVECGVWRGGSAAIMAMANGRYGKARRVVHLFDAWGDWPDPTNKDGNRFDDLKQGTLLKADNDGALAACRELFRDVARHPADLTVFHQGLFDRTIPAARDSIGPIALLRVDCDWYEPILLCLEHLWPLVSSGGIVVFDDYGYCDGARRATDEFLASTGRRHLLHFVDYACRYVVKP